MIKYLKYTSALVIPIVVLISLFLGGYFAFIAIIVVFGVIPFLELFSSADTRNMDAAEEALVKADRVYDYLLYTLVPIQFFILGYFLYRVSNPSLQIYEIVGLITAYGMACGLSINNAHELGHRSTRYEQMMSKGLLMTSLYMHFYIEHNRGHHLNVATDEDPASSRYGENLYAFFARSITGSWRSAWRLEAKRLDRVEQGFWTLHNEMIRFHLIQSTLILGIGLVLGPWVMFYFICGAFIGILMLETVNYIEHYGLTRQKQGKRYERTLPIHSWNSNHPIGRMILLELSRHSDHHFMTNRKYQTLRHFDESPQMPTGYPGMMLLSLCPPLWFKVMHRRIESYREMLTSRP